MSNKYKDIVSIVDKNSEVHLFLLWEKARVYERKILNYIESNFNIINVTEITWSEKYFSSNLSRFYGENMPKGCHKEVHCGNGPMLAIIVEDANPQYNVRLTSKGNQEVNINIFDAKRKFRDWTGGGHKIHATNTTDEANHDLMLLLGKNTGDYKKGKKWNGSVDILDEDLIGYDGWGSLEQFFSVLNSSCKYVVLRNFECFPDNYHIENHGDIDLLVDDKIKVINVSNAKKVFNEEYRVCYTVKINNVEVPFDFRYLNDNYYDNNWATDILKERILDSGFFRPNPINHYFSLMYHAIIHKPELGKDYSNRLENLASKNNFKNINHGDVSELKQALECFMSERDYDYTDPIDQSVFFNYILIGDKFLSRERIFYNLKINNNDKCEERFLTDAGVFNTTLMRPIQRYSYQLLANSLKLHGNNILLLGSGNGALTETLSDKFDNIIAIEDDPLDYEISKTRFLNHQNISLHYCNYLNSNFGEKYDLVFSLQGMSSRCFSKADLKPDYILNTLIFALKDKGSFIFGFPNLNKINKVRKELNTEYAYDPTEWNPEYIINYLNKNNIKIKHRISCFGNKDATKLLINNNELTRRQNGIGLWIGKATNTYYPSNSIKSWCEISSEGNLSDYSDYYILYGGMQDASLKEFDWTVYSENNLRAKQFQTKTYKKNSEIIKEGTPNLDSMISFTPLCKSKFIDGISLDNLLMENIGLTNQFKIKIDKYINYLIKNYSLPSLKFTGPYGKKDIILDGSCIDVIPRNIIIKNDTWNIIDQEWNMNVPICLSLILYRALYSLFDITDFTELIINRYKIESPRTINDYIDLILKTNYNWLNKSQLNLHYFQDFERAFRQYGAGTGPEELKNSKIIKYIYKNIQQSAWQDQTTNQITV